MADYISKLQTDLLEQFKDKKNIKALVDVIDHELQEVYFFYEQLRHDRNVTTATGAQLDGVGNIVDLTRVQAGLLAGDPIPFDIMNDATYRQYLIYKILKNTCDCTYPDIIKAFSMFWDRPLYYSEDPEQPATMIFDTGEMDGTVDTSPLFRTPLIRAAGITLKLYARTRTDMPLAKLNILSGLGFACTESHLPTVERNYDFQSKAVVSSGFHTVSEDILPMVERKYKFHTKASLSSDFGRVSEDILPPVERNYEFSDDLHSGMALHNVTITPIGGIVKN